MASTADGDSSELIDLGRRPEDKIQGLFMDPTSTHVIVCMYNARDRQFDTVYVHSAVKKPVALKRLKVLRQTVYQTDFEIGALRTKLGRSALLN